MFLIKITLLLFCNLFIQISTSPQPSDISKTRKSNGNYDECVCFPAGQSLIPELLNPNGYGLERLVVYLYRDVNTNQIKMFLPSPEKQQLIPNIPFEVGDALRTITTETITSLFNTNPNYAFNGDQILTNYLPIGLNTGKIKHNLSPNYLTDYSQQLKIAFQNDAPVAIPNISPWDFKNPYQLNPIQRDLQIPNQISVPLYKQDIYAPGGKSSQEGITFDQWFNRQMAIFQDVKSPGDIRTINTDLLRSLIQKTLFENHMHISATGLITDTNGLSIDLNNLELRPILIGNPVNYQQSLAGLQSLQLPKHLPYLEGILITLIYPPKILGVIPLGKIYVAQQALGSANALIDHFITKTAPKASPSTLLNPFSSTNQPNNNWINSNLISTPNSAIGTQVPSNFGLGSSIAFSNGPKINGMWRRKSNKQTTKHSDSKGNITSEPQPHKISHDDIKAWFKKVFGSPFTRKSGSPFYNNWRPPPPWISSPNPNVPPPYSMGPSSVNPWGSSLNSVNSNVFPSNQLQASPIFPGPFSAPGIKLNSPLTLIATALNPKQNQYPNQNVLSAQPLGNPLPHQITNSPSPPALQPTISTSEYSGTNNFPARSPFMRLDSDTSDQEAASLGVIASSKPVTAVNPIITPNLSYSFGAEISKSANDSDALTENKIVSSETILNDGRPSGGTRRYPMPVIQGVLKTLIDMVLQNLSPETLAQANEYRTGDSANDRSKTSGEESDKSEKKLDVTDRGGSARAAVEPRRKEPAYDSSINHIQKTGEVEDGELPDFRIIGGSAATGSGSPLSNKGRSGAND